MNEVGRHDFSTQELANLIGQQSQNVNLILGKVTELSKNLDEMENRMQGEINDIRGDISEMKNNAEITTQQRNRVRKAVNRQVYKVLGLPESRSSWDKEDCVKYKKYSHIFHQRCYAEVTKKGHLSSPYGTTIAQNYIQAINDIEAWTPSNGIDGLMKEADDNAYANRIAKEQGYV